MSAGSYRPGYCNIGRSERRKRYRYAAVGAIAAVVYFATVAATDTPDALVLGTFVPLSLACEWYIQARVRFCVRFALLGRYDLTGSGGEAGKVTDPDARSADARYAIRITVISIALAAVATAVVYGIVAIV